MNKFLALLIGVVSALQVSRVAEPIKDEYVVMFHKNVSATARLSHYDAVEVSAKILFKYDFPGFQGYSAVMGEKALSSVLDSPLVSHVEENGVMRISDEPNDCTTQQSATWGLVRTAEEDLVLTGEYKYLGGAGSGVMTYVIDTGIYCGHNDFGNRCQWGANFVDSDDSDGNGHGTHVAGTMVGNTYGLAKSAMVKAVKVLSAGGSGSTAGVIAGVNWVVEDAIAIAKKAGKMVAKAVGNMSLGGGRSTALNAAVDAAHDAEIVMAVASGNSLADACNYSPASAANAVCVSSSTNQDAMSSFSNWGSCVDIFGPGTSITSAWIGGPNSINTISGTSMASPHVAGVVAKLMHEYPAYDADKIVAEMDEISTRNKLSGVRGSPNKLCYHGCIDG
jgi:subtilisin family serine protease